jgi:hypothetical protein
VVPFGSAPRRARAMGGICAIAGRRQGGADRQRDGGSICGGASPASWDGSTLPRSPQDSMRVLHFAGRRVEHHAPLGLGNGRSGPVILLPIRSRCVKSRSRFASRFMKNTEWDAALIREAVLTSGKPLEVRCAQAFLRAGWKARLGSHFSDGGLGAARELDVLAEKETPTAGTSGMIFRVRALVSCRGFRPERSPFVYSVSTSCVPSFVPRLLSSHRARRAFQASGTTTGPIDHVETSSAARLLKATELQGSRPVVAFDMMERTETVATPKKSASVDYKRSPDGDKQLFGAIDSSTKAAFLGAGGSPDAEPAVFCGLERAYLCPRRAFLGSMHR